MVLNKERKQKIIEDLREKINRQKAIAFVDFSGLKVKDLVQLRKEMKEADCELKVAKKTLISLVFKEKKWKFNSRELVGEIALGFGYKDEATLFKILYNFSQKNENLKILGGLIDKKFLDREEAKELGQLPSREEILTQLFFRVKSPILSFYNVFQKSLMIIKPR